MKLADSLKIVISCGLCLSAGLLGSVFSAESITDWYPALKKPPFTPPPWLFGPVWTALYILMGISAFLIWKKGLKSPKVKLTLLLFIIQLSLNAAWTPIFFGLKMPLLAFADILLLWAAILLTIICSLKISKTAAILLVPYIIWVTFAAVLNAAICLLNR